MPHKDPRDPRGRESKRKHYYKNKQAYIDRARVQKLELAQIYRDLKCKPCADCGVEYPYYVMQYDHLGDKVCNVGKFVAQNNKKLLLEEIAKCEVVCANCHAARTWRRSLEKVAPSPPKMLSKEYALAELQGCLFDL